MNHDGIKLWRTTAFRLSMVYAFSFWLLSLVALLLAYVHTLDEVNRQIDAGLRGEVLSLESAADQVPLSQLSRVIAARSTRESLNATDRGDPGPRFYLLVDRNGRYRAGSMPHWQRVLRNQGDTTLNTIELKTPPAIADLVESRDHFRLRSYQVVLPSGARLLVGQALNELAEMRTELIWLIVIIIFLMISAGTAGGWWIGRTVVRSLSRVMHAADRIMAGDLSQRIVTGRQTDEFALLASRLNQMLARIESLMTDLHEVTENVAHDLRTPLTRLRAHAELALSQSREKQTRDALQTVIQESETLVGVLEAIMGIAQVEAGKREQWQAVDLKKICLDVIDLYEPLAEEKHIGIEIAAGDRVLRLEGSEQLLAQAIGNLLDNAIKYTPEHGRIRMALSVVAGHARLTLVDSGSGIPQEFRDKALQRFVRLDNSRSKPGNGLGLAMVRAIVRQHNGTMWLAAGQDELCGLEVSVNLPLANDELLS